MPNKPICFGKRFHSQATECRYECSVATICCGQTRLFLAEQHNPYMKNFPAWLAYVVIMTRDKYPCTREELQREVMATARERGMEINERAARWAVNRTLRDLFKKGMVSVIPSQVNIDIRVGDESNVREPAYGKVGTSDE